MLVETVDRVFAARLRDNSGFAFPDYWRVQTSASRLFLKSR